VSFQDAVTTVLTKKYADFSGRARRSEFWFYALATFIAGIVVNIIDMIIGTKILSYVLDLALLIPGLAVGARRLHDTGRSGWWQLLWFAIIIGWIVLFIWFVSDSKPGTNQYGPSPKEEPGFGEYGQAPNAGWGQA
jgi:uncharacterized membrane protein YhaH (DUF805 family)